MYRVGINWGRSRLRRRRRERHETESGAQPPVSEPDVEMRQVLEGLPLEQRSVVVFRYYLGFSTEETAEALGIKQGTVKSRLSRALERLGDSLGGER